MLNNKTTLTPEEFVQFLKRCEDIDIDLGVVSFNYMSNRGEYHYDNNHYSHSDQQVLDRVRRGLDYWSECETDQERRDLLEEWFMVSTGEGGNYDTVGIQTDFYEEELRDYEEDMSHCDHLTWVEIYPYRGALYSGEFDLNTMTFQQWKIEQSGQPCGGSADSYVVVPDRVLSYLKEHIGA